MAQESVSKQFNSWYRLTCAILGVYVRLCVDEILTYGQEHLFKGPKILVGNHPNASDGLCLPSVIPEHLHFAVQSEVFTIPVIGHILKHAGQIPVARGKGPEFLQKASQILERGFPVVIFPEGKLNMNTGLHRAGNGAAALALNTGLPLVPFGFYAPEKNIRIIRSRFFGRSTIGGWQFGGKLIVQFGEAFRLDTSSSTGDLKENLRKQTEIIMGRIDMLSQQARAEASRLGLVRPAPEIPRPALVAQDQAFLDEPASQSQPSPSYHEAENSGNQSEIHLSREK
jgi:1-acyl-sn-glycerol-3-phosphate acyltransferase